MTVYTGLLDEVIDGIPVVEPAEEDWDERIRPMFELVTVFGAEDDDCWCDCIGAKFSRDGVVCSGEFMRWLPGDVIARFDQFTPPYVAGDDRG